MASAADPSGPEGFRRPALHKTLSFRITVIYCLFLSIVILGFYTLLYRWHAHNTLELVDDNLRQVRAESAGSIPQRTQRLMQWVDGEGRVQKTSRALNGTDGRPRVLPIPIQHDDSRILEESFETVEVKGFDYRIRLASFPLAPAVGGGTLQIGYSLAAMDRTLSNYTTAMIVVFPLVIAITIVSGLSIAKKALNPITEITQTARRISAQNLSGRLSVSAAGDELDLLSETLNEMIERLEASFERTRRFTADASHELRTPLTSMRGEAELALRAERAPEEYKDTLGSILEEIDRLSSIVSDLLILSRSELRSDLSLEPVDLGDLLTDVHQHMRVLAEAQGLSLEAASFPSVEVLGDRNRLTQLFMNLVDNAVKYSPNGGAIRLELTPQENDAVVTIADSGIGIPQEDLPRIFDRFYRVDPARAKTITGNGLGLSICKWIVDSHGGSITAESTVGTGTTFTVRLPAEASAG